MQFIQVTPQDGQSVRWNCFRDSRWLGDLFFCTRQVAFFTPHSSGKDIISINEMCLIMQFATDQGGMLTHSR